MPDIYTNSYTAPTALTSGDPINVAPINSFFTTSNSINDQLTRFGNSLQVASSGTAVTLIQNRDVSVTMSNTANAVVTLPAATGQYKTIKIKKTAFNNALVTITRAGSDVIEDYDNPLSTPIATTLVLYTCDDFVELEAVGTTWRIMNIKISNRIGVMVYATAAQTITAGTPAILQFNTVNTNFNNLGGFWNTSTYKFTPLVPGYYSGSVGVIFNTGSSANLFCGVGLNGATTGTGASRSPYMPPTTGIAGVATQNAIFKLNGSTDYISFFGGCDVANRATLTSDNAFCTASIIKVG